MTPQLLSARPRAHKLHALTSLRFFAAVFVVFFHTLGVAWPSIGFTTVAGRTLSLGFTSVSFFFLLSGYILAVVYLCPPGPIHVRQFYKARFARVYPLFLLTLLLDTPHLLSLRIAKFGLHAAVLATAATFTATATMLQAYSMKLRGIDDPNWSLAVEAVFYLIFPFIGVLLWRLRGLRLLLAATFIYVGGQILVAQATIPLSEDLTFIFPLLHVSTFLLGILLARWQTLQAEREDPERRSNVLAPLIALAFAASGIAATVHWLPIIPHALLHDGLLAPVFACIIWVFSNTKGVFAKMLGTRWLVVLGEASFGLYLIHIPVLHIFQAAGMGTGPGMYTIYLMVCIGLSVVSFYAFEAPARRWVLSLTLSRPRTHYAVYKVPVQHALEPELVTTP